MPTFDDVRRLALALPETEERPSYGRPAWWVGGRLFVWDRALRKTELAALGDAAPDGPLLGARVEHRGAKEALLADPSGAFVTTPHFDGHPIVLVRLDVVAAEVLEEVVTEAWLCRAPDALAAGWLSARAGRPAG